MTGGVKMAREPLERADSEQFDQEIPPKQVSVSDVISTPIEQLWARGR